MPYKDPNSPAAKASAKRRSEKYRNKNREKLREKYKEYNNSHKKERAEWCKNSDLHYKSRTIHNWKRIGVKFDDLESLFELYLNETKCWICLEEFDKRINKHLDHDHETGEFRYILCRSCNISLR